MEPTLDSVPTIFRLEEGRKALREGTGRGVRVAVVDSGIEIDHPDLLGLNLVDDLHVVDAGIRIEVKPGDGSDVFGHGTAVAAVIHGIAPEAELGSIRVLNETNSSRTDIIREGVRQAIDLDYHIINCSFGCGTQQDIFKYKEWIDEAYLKGIHIVAACNNLDFRRPEWPGYFATVITVNMARVEDQFLYYKPGHLVEFAARGVNITLPWHHRSFRTVTGSSFATPIAAGLLARLISAMHGLKPLEAKAILHRLAMPWDITMRGPNVAYSVP